MVLRYFEKKGVAVSAGDPDLVRVYGYGTPSCVDANLADLPQTLNLVTTGKRSGGYFVFWDIV